MFAHGLKLKQNVCVDAGAWEVSVESCTSEAKEAMNIAEKLYTQGLISYRGQETNMFPKEFDLQALIGNQTGDPAWEPYVDQAHFVQ